MRVSTLIQITSVIPQWPLDVTMEKNPDVSENKPLLAQSLPKVTVKWLNILIYKDAENKNVKIATE